MTNSGTAWISTSSASGLFCLQGTLLSVVTHFSPRHRSHKVAHLALDLRCEEVQAKDIGHRDQEDHSVGKIQYCLQLNHAA